MRHPRTHTALVVTMAAAMLVAFAWTATAQDTLQVEVIDNAYSPESPTIAPGDTVTWTHTGNLPHSVTADDGAFDSHPDCGGDCMNNGDTFSFTFDEPGEYAYYCRIHGAPGGVGMSGVILVTADGATTSPSPTAAETPTVEETPTTDATPTPTPTGDPTPSPTDDRAGDPTPTPDPTTAAPTPTAPADTGPTYQDPSVDADAGTAADEQLADTGTDAGWLAALAVATLVLGGGALVATRARR